MGLRSLIHRLTAPPMVANGVEIPKGEVKLVCIVNHGIKMGKGKIAAQVGHAAVKSALAAAEHHPNLMQAWLSSGQQKVVVKAVDAAEIEKLVNAARRSALPACTINDAGRTQIPAGTLTVGAIGPAEAEEINQLTGHLKLL
ncbi:MAG: peptidyl-tRNA hydrolase Pth2 [Candidatus Poseidoniaceae archaeon]|nr:peptidyl-tRNA hydrolase Pth2 [Candidatus Poseidoniaceae archaeon]MDP7000398.1 peptidyl-tRNA hydrolase Pth2 [Candidatus Poseidoniaceae archaeon]